MPSSSSSAQQALRALGVRLRELRLDARLSGLGLGQLAGWHSSKISKIEHGRRPPSVEDILTWCQHCGAAEQAPELIASLRTIEGMFIEWRRMEHTGLRRAQESVLPLWERTQLFRIYSSWLVPGPIQTPAYVTAVLTSIMTRRSLPNDIEQAVQVRVDKQQVLQEAGRRFVITVEESVLRHPIGGPETMAGQLGHLLAVGALPHVSLGIVPLDTDRSAMWPAESFWLFDDTQVNVELTSGHLRVTQPIEIGMYAKAFTDLSQQATYGAPARKLVTAAIDALDAT